MGKKMLQQIIAIILKNNNEIHYTTALTIMRIVLADHKKTVCCIRWMLILMVL
jgi:hypothetical protein